MYPPTLLFFLKGNFTLYFSSECLSFLIWVLESAYHFLHKNTDGILIVIYIFLITCFSYTLIIFLTYVCTLWPSPRLRYGIFEGSLMPFYNPYFSIEVAAIMTSITIGQFAFSQTSKKWNRSTYSVVSDFLKIVWEISM